LKAPQVPRLRPAFVDAMSDPPCTRSLSVVQSHLSVDRSCRSRITAALQNASAPVIRRLSDCQRRGDQGADSKDHDGTELAPSQRSIAAHYQGLIDRLVVDSSDESEAATCPSEPSSWPHRHDDSRT